MEVPSFKYLRPENFNKLDEKEMDSLVNLTKFHIDSFDWMVDQGLRHAIKRIPPVEFKIKKQESKPMEIVRDLKLNKTQSNFDIATDFLSDPFLPEV